MSKLKVAVFGCGGIIGTHMLISVPEDIEPYFVRKTHSPLADSLDLTNWPAALAWLNERRPDVIINLAGESRPDVVERDPGASQDINVTLPLNLVEWCDSHGSHLIQVSSQAVYNGQHAPYSVDGLTEAPVNEYGRQKAFVDYALLRRVPPAGNWTIVRPTFVLGIRPFPAIGRKNPAEAMLDGSQVHQVDNRFFSVSFAWDVAEVLWETARQRPSRKTVHVGNPGTVNRFGLAQMLNPAQVFEPVTQEHFEATFGIAPRPRDTTYADGHFSTPLNVGLKWLAEEYQERVADGPAARAYELAAFLKLPIEQVQRRLNQGFGPLHNAVTADFNRVAPKTDEELLAWYRTTEAYIWELTAYHCDAGFNYSGMCEGIITRLKTHRWERLKPMGAELGMLPEPPPYRVLCLGDGVGTLTIKMKEAGLQPVYHDLAGSRTAAFAWARFNMRFADPPGDWCTNGFAPPQELGGFDAVCSLDFLEHCINVEDWVRFVFGSLKPGGLFAAQNAFAIGSGPQGDMPMHLACNDRWEKDWDPLLTSVGFVQLAPQWYQRPE